MDWMPKPTEAHAKLAQLAGSWEGTETMHPSPWMPQGGTAIGRFESRMLDGFFLIHDYEQEQGGHVNFRGHGMYGWSAATQKYSMYWADSMGTDPNLAYGDWVGDTITFQHAGPMGHHRYIYKLIGADRFAFRIESSRDGEAWTAMMDGEYRRRG
jgi:hypothetical protein